MFMRIIGATLLLASSTTLALAAGDEGGVGSRATTGTQTNSQQTNVPATGNVPPATTGGSAGAMAAPKQNAQATHPTYPATVGPTGSTQPDATNPNRSAPGKQ
jgi:hypothetical protein